MAESTSINVQAFSPNKGGRGKRMAVTTVSAAVAIPGLSGGVPAPNARVLVSNGGAVSVFIVMGNASIVADLSCLEILPGCVYLLTPPTSGPTGTWLAAISETVSTSINIMFGEGS